MIKVEVIKEFTLRDFYKIKDSLVRKAREKEGYLYVGDVFECDEEMVKYLTGGNVYGNKFVKVIETIPEAKIVEVVEEKVELPETMTLELKKPTKKSKKKKS